MLHALRTYWWSSIALTQLAPPLDSVDLAKVIAAKPGQFGFFPIIHLAVAFSQHLVHWPRLCRYLVHVWSASKPSAGAVASSACYLAYQQRVQAEGWCEEGKVLQLLPGSYRLAFALAAL